MKINKVSLKDYSSLRIGGYADMVNITNEDELVEAVEYAKEKSLQTYVLGNGTNTFFAEDLENILILKIEIIGKSRQDSENNNDVFVTAQAGEVWDDIVKFCVENNLWGIENLSYIPGSVGATPIQNIGAYGVELKDIFVSLRALDTEKMEFVNLNKEECLLDYRDSLFKKETGRYIIVSVTLRLSKENKPVLTYKPLNTLIDKKELSISDIRELVIQTRAQKLPDYKIHPNAGSFFKNVIINSLQAEILQNKFVDIPLIKVENNNYKISSAWLIENVANMKGARIGSIGTWPTQPLVIVNYDDGSSKDLISFEEEIKKRILKETGLVLEREVNFVNK